MEEKEPICFSDITNKLEAIYKRKNHDYGNSFNESVDEFGIIASVVRINDKVNRLKSLLKKESLVQDESIKDTFMDLANYSIMTVMYLENQSVKNK